MTDYWLGIDPGGKKNFGLAFLFTNGTYETTCVSSVKEAIQLVTTQPLGVGIDSPLWWSSEAGGGRKADQWIRDTYSIHSGTVQSVNSLRGAVLVTGMLFAMKLRQFFPGVRITESHPKALLLALEVDPNKIQESWEYIDQKFGVSGLHNNNEDHERDAVIAALSAREGFEGCWLKDLSEHRGSDEVKNSESPFGKVRYFWP